MKYLKPLRCLGVLCVTACLAACSTQPSANEAPGYTTRIGGDAYVIRQLTASTWTATTPGSPLVLPATPKAKADLLNAIEQSSGCKVTDSDYSLQGRQLDAQVDCDSHPKSPSGLIKK